MKAIILAVITLVTLYGLFTDYLEYSSTGNPMPENVRDVYSHEEFLKWQSYQYDNCRLSFIRAVVMFAVDFLLVLTNALPAACRGINNDYLAAIIVVLVYITAESIIELPFSWYKTMSIEQKYGFNKTEVRTFAVDKMKEFTISLVLFIALLCLFILLHKSLGDMLPIVFAVLLMLLVTVIGFLFPVFSKLFNTFTELEDGELRDKLTALLNKYGYTVRGIKIMDASRRTTKSNAYFSGFGKMKTIVLYDNLVNSATPDEICAVFSHEMGHGLHKDTLKNNISSFAVMIIVGFGAWLIVKSDAVFTSCGFSRLNYGFALFVLINFLAFINPVTGILRNMISRRAEYRADAQAVKDGYGRELISALKKLFNENYGNLAPHRLTVLLEYSHPTLSERISAIEAELAKSAE